MIWDLLSLSISTPWDEKTFASMLLRPLHPSLWLLFYKLHPLSPSHISQKTLDKKNVQEIVAMTTSNKQYVTQGPQRRENRFGNRLDRCKSQYISWYLGRGKERSAADWALEALLKSASKPNKKDHHTLLISTCYSLFLYNVFDISQDLPEAKEQSACTDTHCNCCSRYLWPCANTIYQVLAETIHGCTTTIHHRFLLHLVVKTFRTTYNQHPPPPPREWLTPIRWLHNRCLKVNQHHLLYGV